LLKEMTDLAKTNEKKTGNNYKSTFSNKLTVRRIKQFDKRRE